MDTQECLLIFTRYPEPGKTKTRLIPALGEAGAANLQQQMTQHTLKQAKELRSQRPLSIQVYYAGGSSTVMQAWLGPDLTYCQQGVGDLGQRMKQAFQSALAAGMERVVAIGTDCPDIDAAILAKALTALKQHDLVLGPAEDGGYYLIGLKRLVPELFTGIDWGTETVLRSTQHIAQTLGLTVYSLRLLNDVDRPEDLSIWEPYQQ
ncbi:MAG: TIGR04282 family arsenosugar biosynthesis glycosyltransferase [Cyanophyceae cyanobacterium]